MGGRERKGANGDFWLEEKVWFQSGLKSPCSRQNPTENPSLESQSWRQRVRMSTEHILPRFRIVFSKYLEAKLAFSDSGKLNKDNGIQHAVFTQLMCDYFHTVMEEVLETLLAQFQLGTEKKSAMTLDFPNYKIFASRKSQLKLTHQRSLYEAENARKHLPRQTPARKLQLKIFLCKLNQLLWPYLLQQLKRTLSKIITNFKITNLQMTN